jgi:hypothetical protein
MDEGVQEREGIRKRTFHTGLCPGPRRLTLGAEMLGLRRKREGPVLDPSRISASGSVLGVLASMFLSPGQLSRSVSQGAVYRGIWGCKNLQNWDLTAGALIGD